MNKNMKKQNCSGCEDNFYNGNNDLGVKKCWNFKDAKIIQRKKVGLSDRPPYNWKPQKFPNCYRQKGYVFINEK